MADFTGANGPLRELALFAGAGGGILGGKLLGWRTVCAVEYDAYAASVLVARQNDGCLEPFPVWDDVRTFDGRPWRGIVDVVSGGFPCQDISSAGKGAGIDGDRSGLWSEMARIISEVRPRFAFVENSPMLTSRGLGRVLGDLAEMGFDAKWGVFLASDFGASHDRARLFISASHSMRNGTQRRHYKRHEEKGDELLSVLATSPFPRRIDDLPQPRSLGVRNGVPNRVGWTRAIGNAQVPLVAALAWQILTGCNGNDS